MFMVMISSENALAPLRADTGGGSIDCPEKICPDRLRHRRPLETFQGEVAVDLCESQATESGGVGASPAAS